MWKSERTSLVASPSPARSANGQVLAETAGGNGVGQVLDLVRGHGRERACALKRQAPQQLMAPPAPDGDRNPLVLGAWNVGGVGVALDGHHREAELAQEPAQPEPHLPEADDDDVIAVIATLVET
jgi:hypothetical protein